MVNVLERKGSKLKHKTKVRKMCSKSGSTTKEIYKTWIKEKKTANLTVRFSLTSYSVLTLHVCCFF